MKRIHSGDTLIEVLFAFAILATITGFTFSAAMQGYKGAVQAQNHTQAIFLAQHQADGLKTYRDSLDWNDATGPSFIGGFTSTLPGVPSLPAMKNLIGDEKSFCMTTTKPAPTSQEISRWEVQSNSSQCNNSMGQLAPNLKDLNVRITLSNARRFEESSKSFVEDSNNPDQVTATISVTYDIANATVDGRVVHTIILTRSQ